MDTSSTLSLVDKWGPSTRTITRIVGGRADEEDIAAEARASAVKICGDPSLVDPLSGVQQVPDSLGSSLLFIRPHRKLSANGDVTKSADGIPFIPTKVLSTIFESARIEMSNDKSLQLFKAFSSHSLTRSAAGWLHEKRMHSRLSSGEALIIFRGDESKEMPTSTQLLPGTASGIASSGSSDSFYWIPSVINFPGVDGVLGDIKGNLYAVQATIARDHKSPVDGLRLVWENVGQDLRGRTWHLLVVADSESAAHRLVTLFSKKVTNLTLGRERVRVEVWGCVLLS